MDGRRWKRSLGRGVGILSALGAVWAGGFPASGTAGSLLHSTEPGSGRFSVYDAARDSIDFQIQAPDSVPEGDEVPVILRLLNVTEEPVELRLTGRPVAFDVEVERVGGDIVWRRLHGRAVSMILQLRELAPGEVLEFSAAWEQQTNEGDRAGPGTYRIRGVLPTDQPDPLTTPWAALRIVAR